jgi:hypothetical protein
VSKKGKQNFIIGGIVLFVIYIFSASQPIPIEIILTPQWFVSLESTYALSDLKSQNAEDFFPFRLGSRFGYVNNNGNFTINQMKGQNQRVSLSQDKWTEYAAAPEKIEVRNPLNEVVLVIDRAPGYPFFLDKRIFFLSKERNSLSLADDAGNVLWVFDFAAPITVIDAANDFVLVGLLDGSVTVLNGQGRRIFFFEPGGSRIPGIYGCAISKDATRLALVSGLDLQRFLVLERYGNEDSLDYKVIYHEFLEDGFRRSVNVTFIDNDNRVAFERQGSLGLYDINARKSIRLPLEGEIQTIDEIGTDQLLFLITSQGEGQKRFVGVQLPGSVIIEAPFKSETFFLGRRDSRVYVGGAMTLASFELEKR